MFDFQKSRARRSCVLVQSSKCIGQEAGNPSSLRGKVRLSCLVTWLLHRVHCKHQGLLIIHSLGAGPGSWPYHWGKEVDAYVVS